MAIWADGLAVVWVLDCLWIGIHDLHDFNVDVVLLIHMQGWKSQQVDPPSRFSLVIDAGLSAAIGRMRFMEGSDNIRVRAAAVP